MIHSWTRQFASWAIALCLAGGASWGASLAERFEKEIQPILKRACYDCHGEEKRKGDLDLTGFKSLDLVHQSPEVWQNVFERVQAFEMPPKRAPELKFDEQRKLVEWLRELPKASTNCNQLASDRTANFYRGYVMSRRLNRAEYLNTIRDLFGVEVAVHELLPADGGGGEGFDTTGSALFTSSIHIEKYIKAAELILSTVLPDSARGLTPAIAEARSRILVARPGLFTKPRDAARRVIAATARKAFRRPVEPAEVDRFLSLFDRAAGRGDGYAASLRLALKGVLISPHFLFLAEPEPAVGGIQPLAPVPLASKLSYFLWSSMPDEELLKAAESGALAQTNVLRQQVQRMLADPKASSLGSRFALQWLDLDRLGTEIRPDPTRYPEFTDQLAASMRGEVVAFFNHLVKNDRPLTELIDAGYTFVDERLAALYGIPGIKGERHQQVTLTDQNRGGLLGMAAVHAATSYPYRTSPVLRGKWLLESVLGDKVPPPPPDTPLLDEAVVNASKLSFRKQFELHRAKAECAACHERMDPLGFGLENFDLLGRWRDTDRGQPVDAVGTLPSGETFTGPKGLKTILVARQEKILRHMARKMTGFAFGRELNSFDDCVIDNAMKAMKQSGFRVSVLVEAIVTSTPFQNRFYPKQES